MPRTPFLRTYPANTVRCSEDPPSQVELSFLFRVLAIVAKPNMMAAMQSRPIAADERETVIAFLKCEGYIQPIGESDRLFVSELAGVIVGAVRLCQDEGVLVLRGMRVRGTVQRQGVGTHLLQRLVLAITDAN